MYKARKGVSPIVSVILLILIAVAATVILFSWFSGTAGQNPTTEPALQEKVKIDGVNVQQATGKPTNITVFVRNIGNSPVTVTAAYVINATSGSVVYSKTNITATIQPGNATSIDLNKVFNTPQTGVFIVKVVTDNGVEATYTFSVS